MPNELVKEKLNILICDDDPIVLDKLLFLAQKALSPQWDADYHCVTDPDLLPVAADSIHIAVLDIALDQKNGISLAHSFLCQNPDCRIVFVSGYPRYVSDVYDVPHLGMVLKDQLENQLPKFLLRAAESIRASQNQTILVPSNRSVLRLSLPSILYLERKEHITYLNLTSGQKVRTRKKLEELLSQPCGRMLCRCHVSYAVNLSHVIDFQVRDFILADGERVPISRVYMRSAKAAYYAYLQDSIC